MKVSDTLVFIGLLLRISSSFIRCSNRTQTVWSEDAVGFIKRVLDVLNWRNLVFLHEGFDPCLEGFLEDLFLMMDEVDVRRSVFKVSPSNMKTSMNHIHQMYGPKIHILYLTSHHLDIVTGVMKIANDFDTTSNRSTEFRLHSKWLIMTNVQMFQPIAKILTDLCHVAVIHQLKDNIFHLKTLIRAEHGNHFLPVDGHSRPEDIFPNVKFHFNGRHLILGALPYEALKRKIVNGTSVYYGWMFDFLEDMAQYLNFTFEIREPRDGDWGIKMANSNRWDGLIGMVQRREIDVLYAEYVITEERSKVMDFVTPALQTTAIGILYRNPGLEVHWASLLKPLSTHVYILLLLSYIVLSLLYISSEVQNIFARSSEVCKESPRICEILVNLMACAFLRGHIHPRTRRGRILYASWWIFCVIIAAVYTGNLTSFLLRKINTIPFTSLRELTELKNWKYGLMKNSAVHEIFENSQNEDLRDIWNGILEQNLTDPTVLAENMSVPTQKILKGNFAFIDGRVSNFVENRNDCLLSYLDNIVNTQYVSFAVPLDYPLRAAFVEYAARRFQSGLLTYDQIKRTKRLSCKNEVPTLQPFSLTNIEGAFLVLLIGFTVSLLALVFERFINIRKRMKPLRP